MQIEWTSVTLCCWLLQARDGLSTKRARKTTVALSPTSSDMGEWVDWVRWGEWANGRIGSDGVNGRMGGLGQMGWMGEWADWVRWGEWANGWIGSDGLTGWLGEWVDWVRWADWVKVQWLKNKGLSLRHSQFLSISKYGKILFIRQVASNLAQL